MEEKPITVYKVVPESFVDFDVYDENKLRGILDFVNPEPLSLKQSY